MLDNHVYDLMNQLVQEHKSLWRIKNEYTKNAQGHEDCEAVWQKMHADKEAHIEELTMLLKKYMG